MVYTTFLQGLKEANESVQASLQLEASTAPTLPNLSSQILPSYIHSATLLSQLLSSGLVPDQHRSAVITKWKMVLGRAEKVRDVIKSLGGELGKSSALAGGKKKEKEDEGEQMMRLRLGSKVNGQTYGLWRDTDLSIAIEEASIRQPDLSPAQTSLGAYYSSSHPSLLSSSSSPSNHTTSLESVPGPSRPRNLRVEQGLGADCSLIASIGVCLQHNIDCEEQQSQGRSQKDLAWGLFSRARAVKVDGKGKNKDEEGVARLWRVRLFVNGTWRSVSNCLETPFHT